MHRYSDNIWKVVDQKAVLRERPVGGRSRPSVLHRRTPLDGRAGCLTNGVSFMIRFTQIMLT